MSDLLNRGLPIGWVSAERPYVKPSSDANVMRQAFGEYVREVREGKFPSHEHCYKMKNGEREKLEEMLKRGIN